MAPSRRATAADQPGPPVYASLQLRIVAWSWWGQTVGMMAVHIKVLSRTGGRVSLRRSALRLLGYAASVAPLFLGIVVALFDRERRTLHDRLAGTVVVELP